MYHPVMNALRKRNGVIIRATTFVSALAMTAMFSGCASSPTNSNTPVSTGAAGGATSVGADSRLQTCSRPVGSVRLQDGNAPQKSGPSGNPTLDGINNVLKSLSSLGMGSSTGAPEAGASLESLSLLIMQSNCFVIVDRGISEEASDDEKQRSRSSKNEARDGANMGQGQEVAADYVLRSTVISLGTKESNGFNLGVLSKFAGGLSAGQSVTEAKVQLVLTDVRSKVRVAAAQGDGSGSNTALAGNVLGRACKALGGVGVKSESKTQSSEVLLQAFADAYNKIVPAVQNFKEQTVQGGLGTGGTLSVQGSRPDPSVVRT